MRSHPVCFAVSALLFVSCGDDAQSPSQPQPTESQKKADDTKREQEIASAKSALAKAYEYFGATATGMAESRRTAYKAFLLALDKAESLTDVKSEQKLRHPDAAKILTRLSGLQQEEANETRSAPSVPEKPKYDPPEYEGAFYLNGRIRRCYLDGVVVESKRRLYFISNGACPTSGFIKRLTGYVEYVRTTTLDFGRDGREADVVVISDKETAQDDKRDHREAVSEYKAEYKRKLAEYKSAINAYENRDEILERRRSARTAERRELLGRLDSVLLPLAKAVNEGKDPGSITVSADLSQAKALSEESKAGGVEERRSRRKSSRSSDKAKPRRKTSRRACLKRCIATCNNDPNCERSCATTRCR